MATTSRPASVVRDRESYTIDETYPWHGAHSVAVNRCNGVKVSLTHNLSQTPYVLEIRAFNDGVAYRHIIPGGADAVPRARTSTRHSPSRPGRRSGTTT